VRPLLLKLIVIIATITTTTLLDSAGLGRRLNDRRKTRLYRLLKK